VERRGRAAEEALEEARKLRASADEHNNRLRADREAVARKEATIAAQEARLETLQTDFSQKQAKLRQDQEEVNRKEKMLQELREQAE